MLCSIRMEILRSNIIFILHLGTLPLQNRSTVEYWVHVNMCRDWAIYCTAGHTVSLDDLTAAVRGGGAKQTLFRAAMDINRQSLVTQGHLKHTVFYVSVVFPFQVQFSQPQSPRTGTVKQRVWKIVTHCRLLWTLLVRISPRRRTTQERNLI